MRTTAAELDIARTYVIYPGSRRYPLADNIEAVPLASLTDPRTLFATQ